MSLILQYELTTNETFRGQVEAAVMRHANYEKNIDSLSAWSRRILTDFQLYPILVDRAVRYIAAQPSVYEHETAPIIPDATILQFVPDLPDML